jgi:heme exporter protein D
VLMGWGSLLIPGSNDGLILIGIPLLRPYAWLAFASMIVVIAAALLAQRAWARRSGLAVAADEQHGQQRRREHQEQADRVQHR